MTILDSLSIALWRLTPRRTRLWRVGTLPLGSAPRSKSVQLQGSSPFTFYFRKSLPFSHSRSVHRRWVFFLLGELDRASRARSHISSKGQPSHKVNSQLHWSTKDKRTTHSRMRWDLHARREVVISRAIRARRVRRECHTTVRHGVHRPRHTQCH
jgi:hypothetical protein